MIHNTTDLRRSAVVLHHRESGGTNRTLLHNRAIARSDFVVLGAALLLGLLLRVHCLDCHGLWYDEIVSVEAAQRGIGAILTDGFGVVGNQTAMHYLLTWLGIQAADPVETTVFVRLPSVLAGVLVPLVVYCIGRETVGRIAGLGAALLSAISVPLVDYSQEARPYSLVVLFSLLTILFLLAAERTGRPVLWVLFSLSAIVNMLNSHVATTLAMPAIGLLSTMLLIGIFSRRKCTGGRKQLYLALAALGSVALFGLLMLAEIGKVSGFAAQSISVSPQYFGLMTVTLLSNLLSMAVEGQSLVALGSLYFVLGVIGVVLAARNGGRERRGTFILAAIVLVTILEVAWLATSRLTYSRYFLFVLPLFFLLVAHSIVLPLRRRPGKGSRSASYAAAVSFLLLLAPFILTIFQYSTERGHARLSYRPDYRGAVAYLNTQLDAEDTVVLVDDSLHGIMTTSFYWRDNPPAQLFDVHDPLLYTHRARGDIYWIVRSWALTRELQEQLAAGSDRWLEVRYFPELVLLREKPDTPPLAEAVERMAWELDELLPNQNLPHTIRASVAQGRGDAEGAAQLYKTLPAPNPLWTEGLATAEGLLQRGEEESAWRYGVLALFDDGSRPEVHRWLAERLGAKGHWAQAHVAQEIADRLLQSAGAR
jgi:hypothetical protein